MFFQKKNLFNLRHYIMIKDVLKFNKQANFDIDNDSKNLDVSLGEYLKDYSQVFKERYLMPMGASIWSTPTDKMNEFPARVFLQFFKNHGLLGISTQHQWLTLSGGSKNYVEKISKKISGKIIKNSDVLKVLRQDEGVELLHVDGSSSHYDKVILAMHAPEALDILDDPTDEELEILSCFTYKKNDAYLHNDTKALYPSKDIYAAWNYKSNKGSEGITLTYWINRLQNLKTNKEYFVSLNENSTLDEVIEKISYSHPQFDKEAIDAQKRRTEISGKNDTFFAGAYWRYGFHEDGLWSANCIAKEFGCEL
jgi:predicted NAD/FAD-binding protein